MYNSAGEFSTFVKNYFRGGRLFGRVVGGLRPPPPLTGLRRGLRPLLGPGKGGFVGHWQGGRRSFFPGRACQRYNYSNCCPLVRFSHIGGRRAGAGDQHRRCCARRRDGPCVMRHARNAHGKRNHETTTRVSRLLLPIKSTYPSIANTNSND